ncbi:MAG: hypothetical protein MUC28_03770, partial [Planctomycetes bacterium]|nr:hypothetical protein [Planctomycetota bacterium]
MKNASFSVNQQLAWRVILPCLAATLAFVGLAGATTIGTNIATDGSLTVTGTTTIDSGVFYVDPTNNRIGIGTIYPNSQLHVYADNGGMIEVSDGGSVRAVLAAEMNLNSATSSAYVGALVGDSFGIRTGGLDRIYVNQYGQVGIGTSTDTQGKPDSPAKLEIWGTPGDNLLNISSSSGESFLRIDPKGYVGIGTTAPGSRLDVNGDINIASGSALKFGGESVLRIVPAYNNIFIGSLSGNLTSGSLNTFVGDRAGEDNTSGWYNTFIGANAGRNNNGGMENAFIGQGSGYNSLSGSYNTIIGSGAGQDLISGYSNVFIGNRAGYTENGNKKLYISTFDGMEYYDLVYGDFGTGELRLGGTHASSSPLLTIAANGNVGIGITSPQAALDIYGNMIISTSSGYLNFGTSTGSGGYGLRDNNGILQFRNMGGSWTDFGTSTGSSYWQENAFNDIYFNHWVGIGTTAPSSRLDVNGDINISLDRGYKQNGITILTSSTTAGSLLVGTGAGANMTSGEWVTYIGYEAGYHSLALLGYNTFVGYRAGYATTDGFSNVFVGTTAGYDNTTGYSNTFIGDDAGHYNVSGFMNVFMGALAGYENRTGNGNILIGDNAGRFNASATNTVAIGHQAGYGAAGTYNQNNVLLGYKAGYGLTTGDNNILLGYQAGDNLTMGDNNILLGYNIDARSPDSANTLNIGNLIFGFGINGEGTDVSSGNIGIGTATPLAKLDVFGNFIISTSSGYLNF